MGARPRRDRVVRGDLALACPGAHERGLRAAPAARISDDLPEAGGMSVAQPTHAEDVETRIWEALRHVEDPEIPVSVLGMGLIISVCYRAANRTAALEITF